ncbi:MAG: superoxide dismutase family protein [Bdellovibrionales bacterium]
MLTKNIIFGMTVFLFITGAHAATPEPVNVVLKNAKGEDVGTAKLTALAQGVRINLDVRGLPPGEHAVHFHEKGACEAPAFESAGSHFSPKKAAHGFDVKKGPHAGDLPNLIVGPDGTARAEYINTKVALGKGSTSLQKKGGTALVIHEKADDYKSQPSGDAGGRFACGQIDEMKGG